MTLNQFRSIDLTWDRANGRIYEAIRVASSDENGRKLTVRVSNGSLVEDLSSATLNLYWETTNAKNKGLDAFEVVDASRGIFEIYFTTGMLSNVGKLYAWLQLVDTAGTVTSERFDITVFRGIDNDAAESENSFTALTTALVRVNNIDADINNLDVKKADKVALAAAKDNLQSQVTTLNANTSNSLNQKVDKNGNEQITLAMLSQPVKTAMTGGSVAVVGTNAVNTTNIVNGAVTTEKSAKNILKATLICASEPPNFDTATKTLQFRGLSNYLDILMWGNSSTDNNYVIPAGTTVKIDNSSTSTAWKLLFDTVTKNFRFVIWSTPLAVNEVLIMSLRIYGGKYIFIADFPVYIDGYAQPVQSHLPDVKILCGGTPGNNFPRFSTKNKTLTFPGGVYDWIFSVDGTIYTNAIPNAGLTIDLSNLAGTSAWYLLFKMDTKEILTVRYNLLTNYQGGYALLGTIRYSGATASISLPIPHLVDGKLFGQNNSGSNVVVTLDAPVKCIHHRGYSKIYPEHTEIAYLGSKKIGVNEVEMDLAFTSDGIPVNLHDTTINRTARKLDGTQLTEDTPIEEITYAEANQYEYGSWKNTEFKGQKLMTFEEAILICKKLDMRLHIDRVATADTTERLNALKTIIDKHKFDNVIFYLYNQADADRIRAILPNADFLYLLWGGDVTQPIIDFCKSKNDVGFCGITAYANTITEAGVRLATSQDVEVYVWNADHLDRNQLVNWGVTGISTDFANIQAELLV